MERIQKILSQAGVASRRKAEELIQKGKVIVNGEKAVLGDKASFDDEIFVDGIPVMNKQSKVYYMINKPSKVITSLRDPQKRTIITDLIDEPRRIFPIGRLDYDTTGILLLTNDGELAHRLSHPSFEVLKVYRARLNRTLTEEELKFLNSSEVIVNDKPSKQKVTKDGPKSYVVTINQGTYHHVKKLFEGVNSFVRHLNRIEYAGLTHVNELSKGQYRRLKPKEIKWLKQLVGL